LKTATTLTILALLGSTFWSLSIAASIAAIYFLYEALAREAPWIFLFWSIVAGLVAKQTATSIHESKRRLDYVEQLMERGYVQVDAEAAWRMAENGGMNLLANLHQVELADEIDRLESALGIPNPENTGN
jgi:hypothetical protein